MYPILIYWLVDWANIYKKLSATLLTGNYAYICSFVILYFPVMVLALSLFLNSFIALFSSIMKINRFAYLGLEMVGLGKMRSFVETLFDVQWSFWNQLLFIFDCFDFAISGKILFFWWYLYISWDSLMLKSV